MRGVQAMNAAGDPSCTLFPRRAAKALRSGAGETTRFAPAGFHAASTLAPDALVTFDSALALAPRFPFPQ